MRDAPAGVLVVGSLNMDLVIKTPRIPAPGETVMGGDVAEICGGKGANQAAAAGSLSLAPKVARMIGRVGDDAFGRRMTAALAQRGVDTSLVIPTNGVPSGAALIVVDDHGQNAIVVSAGANGRLTPGDITPCAAAFGASAVLLLQLETPLETVTAALACGREHGLLVILDPAPVPGGGLPDDLYGVDILTPNQSEAAALTGVPVDGAAGACRAGTALLARGVRTVVIKLGQLGAAIVSGAAGQTEMTLAPGFKVEVADTTAAGDTFNGALGVALAEGRPLRDAVRFANAAGALACTRFGAGASIPSRAEVDRLLARPEG